MRVFTACLGTETNTFSPFVTGYQNFAETCLFRGGDYGDAQPLFGGPLRVWRQRAAEQGWVVIESLCAFAQPAGVTLRPVYEAFRDEIVADLRRALPVDMVLLSMHGAMVAEGYDDCEGDTIAAVREVVGPDVPIGVELDLHCHLTPRMVDAATAIITFKEYPHIDTLERAEELFTIIADTACGKLRPTMALYDCNMLGVFHTTVEPMQSFVAAMQAAEGRDGVLSLSLAHCFPWGDVPDLGVRMLAITDNQPQQAAALAEQFGRKLWDLREQLQPDYKSIDAAIDLALATEGGPVVLADVSDNAGGGAPNDSTFILQALLERGVTNAAIACIWDPIAVALAMEAGEGVSFDMRIGGKMGPMSGDPVDLPITVTKLLKNAHQTFSHRRASLGDAAALHGRGIDIVVNSQRTQTFGPDAFSNLGIDPTQKKILVVKSMQHFYAGFAPIARRVIYVAAPGALVPDFTQLPYQHADRNKWPLRVARGDA